MIAATVAAMVLPSVWAYRALIIRSSFLHTPILQIVGSWALGQFALVWLSLVSAWILSSLSLPLLTITIGVLGFFTLTAFLLPTPNRRPPNPAQCSGGYIAIPAITVTAFTVATALFLPHLQLIDGAIHRSVVFWDYIGVFGLPQTMALGRNFPPTSELMAGVPIAYHYFFFASVGLLGSLCQGDPVFTLNVLSICYFAALLLLIYGFAEQVSGWRVAGLLAVFFTLGSGTLHFFWRAYTHAQRGIEYIITHSFLTKRRPDLLSMIPDGSFGYNGNMFNLFYFVQERQLAGGCLVLLFFSLMLGYCKSMPTRERIVVGSILGLTLQWHLYAFVAIVVAFCMSAGLLHSVRATLQVLIPAIAAAGIQIVCFASQTGLNAYKSGLFSHPTIDFSFASLPDLYPISLAGAVSYWIFALGVKAVLFGAFIFLSPTIGIRRRLVATVALVVACLFLLTNCIRLSPQSIYDNHKWSRPMMLLIDIAIAAAIVGCWRRFRSLPVHAFLVGAILLCSMTGLRENIGYFRSQKMVQVVRVDSELARTIGSSPPDARFLSDYPIEVLAQGRRLYVTRASELPGNPRFDQNYLATEQRDEIAARIWEAPSLSTFCDTAVAAGVDFVTYTPKRQPQWPLHVAAQCASGPLQTTSGAWLRVLSTACACQER